MFLLDYFLEIYNYATIVASSFLFILSQFGANVLETENFKGQTHVIVIWLTV